MPGTSGKYKPRPGALRKVQYPLNIYQETDLPEKDLDEVLDLQLRIAEVDKDTQCYNKYQNPPKKINRGRKGRPRKGEVPLQHTDKDNEEPSSTTSHASKVNNLHETGVSLVPEDFYERAYPNVYKEVPTKLIVNSFPDPFWDSETDCDSDFDLDSEDEDWINDINERKKLNITPSHFELLILKLNKLKPDTLETAVTKFHPALSSDCGHIFSYWKEKILHNKNTSSQVKIAQTEVKNSPQRDVKKPLKRIPKGYIYTDQCIKFTPLKPRSLSHQSDFKALNQKNPEEAAAVVQRMGTLVETLKRFRAKTEKYIFEVLTERKEMEEKMIEVNKMTQRENENDALE